MKRCVECRRHVWETETSCPFCGASQGEMPVAPSTAAVLIAGLATASCGPSVVVDDAGANGDSTSSAAPGSTTDTSNASADETTVGPMVTTTGALPLTSTTDGSSESTDDASNDMDGVSFIVYGAGDAGSVIFECDLFAQDCPDGEKCMPWANDGGDEHNATRCSPIAVNADAIGEECSVEGSAISGLDSCAPGSMCFGVDPTTNLGRCVEFCGESKAAPTCETRGAQCSFLFDLPLPMCLASCDPLDAACPEGFVCATFDIDAPEPFVCTPWSSSALLGDPCDDHAACEAGTVCANSVPACADEDCCVPYCDTTNPDADLECQAAGTSDVCLPFGADAPFDNVGVCHDG